MTTPLLATHRISLAYSVLSFTHAARAYAINTAPSGGVAQVLDRDGTTPISWIDAAQQFWDACRSILDGAVNPATARYEAFSGGMWNLIDINDLTGAGADIHSTVIASQATWTFISTGFNKMRFQVMEHNEGYLGHSGNGYGVSTSLDGVTPFFDGTLSGAATPYHWMVARNNLHIKTGANCVGLTLDQNKKLKRSRHEE